MRLFPVLPPFNRLATILKRFLLLETGDFLLTEGGDKLIID